jgi:hypothetical protein
MGVHANLDLVAPHVGERAMTWGEVASGFEYFRGEDHAKAILRLGDQGHLR